MWKLAALILVACNHAAAKEGCQSGTWYNPKYEKCSLCTECAPKLFELAPCTSTQNTICIDLKKFKIDFHKAQGPPQKNQQTIDKDYEKRKVFIPQSEFYEFVKEWGMILAIVLCFVLVVIVGAVAIPCLSKTSLCGTRKNEKRTRIFSRGRLNTTDYMNNLLNLDRRLAMDEILEKRKTATIFEPQLLNENLYADDVFIDASGFPRHDHDYEVLDNRRSLLASSDHR